MQAKPPLSCTKDEQGEAKTSPISDAARSPIDRLLDQAAIIFSASSHSQTVTVTVTPLHCLILPPLETRTTRSLLVVAPCPLFSSPVHGPRKGLDFSQIVHQQA
uniref:Uncharacterized protein n=1 Tax=Oryza nivara TaxID=4536 RepID=A0A0E0GR55_ORYNI